MPECRCMKMSAGRGRFARQADIDRTRQRLRTSGWLKARRQLHHEFVGMLAVDQRIHAVSGFSRGEQQRITGGSHQRIGPEHRAHLECIALDRTACVLGHHHSYRKLALVPARAALLGSGSMELKTACDISSHGPRVACRPRCGVASGCQAMCRTLHVSSDTGQVAPVRLAIDTAWACVSSPWCCMPGMGVAVSMSMSIGISWASSCVRAGAYSCAAAHAGAHASRHAIASECERIRRDASSSWKGKDLRHDAPCRCKESNDRRSPPTCRARTPAMRAQRAAHRAPAYLGPASCSRHRPMCAHLHLQARDEVLPVISRYGYVSWPM